MRVCVLSRFSCVQLFATMDCKTPGSSVHEILQVRILEWVALPSSRGSSRPRDQIQISYISCTGRIFLTQGLNPGLLHYRQILYCLSLEGSRIWSTYMINASGMNERKSSSVWIIRKHHIGWREEKCYVPGLLYSAGQVGCLIAWGRCDLCHVCVNGTPSDDPGRPNTTSGWSFLEGRNFGVFS